MIDRILASSDGAVAPAGTKFELIETIAAKADGNALCAKQLAIAVRRSGMDGSAIASLPRGLGALYLAIFQRRFSTKQTEWQLLREILEMVIATRAAFPITLAASARQRGSIHYA